MELCGSSPEMAPILASLALEGRKVRGDIALNILARHCDPGRRLTVLTSEALT